MHNNIKFALSATLAFVLMSSLSSSLVAQQQGGITVTTPVVQASGSGLVAGVKIGGASILDVGVGIGNPGAAPVTLASMFVMLEQNLQTMNNNLATLMAQLASAPPATQPALAAAIASLSASIDSLSRQKDRMGNAITPTPTGTGG